MTLGDSTEHARTMSIESASILRVTSSGTHVGADDKKIEMGLGDAGASYEAMVTAGTTTSTFKVYKRRYFGLLQLILLNIVISWDWLTFSSISTTSAQYFAVSESVINWLSTAFLFAFCVSTPVVMYMLNKGGPRSVSITASIMILLGNWIRYAGARANNGMFSVVMFGQLILGLAQPFALTAPTRYSDLWFSEKGRTSATALATLANPLGAAIGQLVNSVWVVNPPDIPNMLLYISIISTVACLPSFFMPARPPTPPSASAEAVKTPFFESLRGIFRNREFWLVFIPFSVYVGFFNSISGLINQILEPYGFSETSAGIAGGVLIIAGLISAAIISPITDRFKQYLLTVRIVIPIHVVCYIGLYFAPSSPYGIAPSIVVCALMGASAFALLPVALEFVVEVTYPYSPEVGSSLLWMGGQLLGGIFTIIQTELKAGPNGNPPANMENALIFSAVVACVSAIPPLTLNFFGSKVVHKRSEVDEKRASDVIHLQSRGQGDDNAPLVNSE